MAVRTLQDSWDVVELAPSTQFHSIVAQLSFCVKWLHLWFIGNFVKA
jgi:hypothetical protein